MRVTKLAFHPKHSAWIENACVKHARHIFARFYEIREFVDFRPVPLVGIYVTRLKSASINSLHGTQ